ncbi:MAG: hydrolase [Alphaproteobacteria bacterium]|jgi:predicted amidohydrolase|nr:hydrolase [Alphaproteobacteria bacterium]
MKNNKIKIVCLQTTSSKDPQKNINMLEELFLKVSSNTDLICLPECVAVFTDKKNEINFFLDKYKQSFFNFISKQAIKKKSSILVGSVPERFNNSKFVNRSYIFNNQGLEKNVYDKINLFDVNLSQSEKYFESKNYAAGKKIVVSDLSWGKLGMSICYDLRFPNLYRKLAKKGADLLSIPAAFTFTTGKAHWHSLIRARAIENGCFVLAPAQCGVHDNGRKTYGHSMIVNPWGKVLVEAKINKIQIISTFINVDEVKENRKKIPSTTDFKL